MTEGIEGGALFVRVEELRAYQARLSAAEEDGRRWQGALGKYTKQAADLREHLKQAEEVVKAAKEHTQTHPDYFAYRLRDAIRRYEETS